MTDTERQTEVGDGDGDGDGVTRVTGPSCEGAGLDCLDDGVAVSCCDARRVTGGTFPMGRCVGDRCTDVWAGGLSHELPEHDATVSDFYLDTFEVTVGRFRAFVTAYARSWRPAAGDGAHPLIARSGWQVAWDANLPADGSALRANLKCNSGDSTWTDTEGGGEQYPINCVGWYEAFAFCAWEGGRLPTEAEWEYASAGGPENRLFPWGPAVPTAGAQLANYGGEAAGASPLIDVGSHPLGVGRWGQHDLAGSVKEQTLDWYQEDWYSTGGATCVDCTNDVQVSGRVVRGGGWHSRSGILRVVERGNLSTMLRDNNIGLRCARTEP